MKIALAFFTLVLLLQPGHAQNIGVGIASPTGKLHIKGAADVPQLIIDANTTQSNTQPLVKLRNSAGTDLLSPSWPSEDRSSPASAQPSH